MATSFIRRTLRPLRPFLASSALAALALVCGAPPGTADSGSLLPAGEKVPAASLIQPKDLAALLKGPAAQRPLLLHVGFRILYNGGHVAGSRYVGPGSDEASLQALRDILRKESKQRAVVLYCGCCPWGDCPNVKPAYQAARAVGMTNVRVLYVSRNLQKDWVEMGYPSAEGSK
jgi:thiosulfate/3-mercaptopyruvate sulfurtransferase